MESRGHALLLAWGRWEARERTLPRSKCSTLVIMERGLARIDGGYRAAVELDPRKDLERVAEIVRHQLTDRQREAVHGRYYYGHSIREVAKRLNRHPSTIREHIIEAQRAVDMAYNSH
jgi:DNA-directed RNA polymerase specialized sigma24 family protein